MRNHHIAIALALLAVTAGAGVLAGRALATGAPTLTPLTYAGTITDAAGKPYPAAQDVTLKFFDKLDATVAKCTAPLTQAEAGTGRFSVVLPVECVQAVHDAPDLWTEATVGAAKTVLPRTHVGAVPFALEADSAKSAGTAVGAGGALKVQIDGFAADLAGLKAGAGGGGGGPWVVDANGVKLGKLVTDINEQILIFLTSKGYLVNVGVDGVISQAEIYYANSDCSGDAYVPTGATILNSRTFWSGSSWWVFKGDPYKSNVPVPWTYNSHNLKGNCLALTANLGGLGGGQVVQISNAGVGLPATIAGPIHMEP